jgi:hypothetical protein
MDLVNRYLNGVRFWLPGKQRDDILAELSEDLRSQIEEREATLGRSLGEADLVALLKERGDPMRVASAYLPQRSLIGPALFPVYTLVLKILAWCFFVPWAAVWLGLVVAMPGYRAAHPGPALLQTWTTFSSSAFFVFGVATGVFAILERTGAAERWRDRWDPRKLRAERDPYRIPRGTSVAGIVAGIVVLAWWALLPRVPSIEGDGVRIALAPAWRTVYWLMLWLTLAGVVTACVNLFRPYWTRLRLGIRAAGNLVGFVVLYAVLGTSAWVDVSAPALPPERAAHIVRGISASIAIGVVAGMAIFAAACLVDVYRLVRWRPARAA